jgi:DNA-binding GntR family transcriptional regulator
VNAKQPGRSQERAYEFIKEQILSCQLEPGQRLKALDLASRLRLSRTPVREALSRLEQEGLVHREGGAGYRVRAMSLKEVMDLYRAREPLEVEAAVEAIPYLDDDMIARLSAILAEAQKLLGAGRARPFLLANRKFHMTLASATRNTVLYQMLSAISDRIRLICEMIIEWHSPRAKEILEENFRILDALKQRDAAAVEAAVRHHLQRVREHASNFFGQETNRLYLGGRERT